jgi:hypothetical protein
MRSFRTVRRFSAKRRSSSKKSRSKRSKRSKKSKKSKKRGGRKKKTVLNTVKVDVSDDFAEIIGAKSETRSGITKKVWVYIKKHKLQKDPKDGRMIFPDSKLAKVTGSVPFTIMKLMGKLQKHIVGGKSSKKRSSKKRSSKKRRKRSSKKRSSKKRRKRSSKKRSSKKRRKRSSKKRSSKKR